MQTLYFCNPGFFDVLAMTTFGINAKPHSDNPIGHFGTGFKYAVAIILRHQGTIKVETWADGAQQEFVFTSQQVTVRGTSVGVVMMNGKPAGFATHLGINWEPWMAFRELYSNMLDEGGELLLERPASAQTIITVDCLSVWEAYQAKTEYFLHSEPLYVSSDYGVEIHPGPSRWYYFRGIAVAPTGEKPTAHTYNRLRGVDLSEERTARYGWQLIDAAASALQTCPHEDLVNVVSEFGHYAEQEFSFNDYIEPSRAFYLACEAAEEKNGAQSYGKRNPSLERVLKEHQRRNFLYAPYVMTAADMQQMALALAFLDQLGASFGDTEIKTVQGLEDSDDLHAVVQDGTVFVDANTIDQGVECLARVLLSVWVQLQSAKTKGFSERQWLCEKLVALAQQRLEGVSA